MMVRLAPTVANIVAHEDEWDANYTSLIPEGSGNFDFVAMLACALS